MEDSLNLFLYGKEPLAYRHRPENLEEFYGQEHIKKILFNMVEKNKMISSIFYGPSGTGKTTLAKIIAKKLGYNYVYLNAIKVGKSDLIDVLNDSKSASNKTLLFFDEIHRFNKLQQDTLLEDLENGNIILIGATTENPYYSINKAIISRVLLFEFKKLKDIEIFKILEEIVSKEEMIVRKEILEYLAKISTGDARVAINMLETLNNADILDEDIKEISKVLNVRNFSDRYDAISAMIKSVRGSDPDAAIYWMAKLLVGGEDPMYIARRLVILSSEDIGLANPTALNIAVSCMNAVKEIGMPESRIILAECAIYLALSPKSNSAYLAIDKAIENINENGAQKVPFHLTKNGSDKYIYPHNYDRHYIKQEYMLKFIKFYEACNNKFENSMKEVWDKIRKGEK